MPLCRLRWHISRMCLASVRHPPVRARVDAVPMPLRSRDRCCSGWTRRPSRLRRRLAAVLSAARSCRCRSPWHTLRSERSPCIASGSQLVERNLFSGREAVVQRQAVKKPITLGSAAHGADIVLKRAKAELRECVALAQLSTPVQHGLLPSVLYRHD